jgi:hypothetical protein
LKWDINSKDIPSYLLSVKLQLLTPKHIKFQLNSKNGTNACSWSYIPSQNFLLSSNNSSDIKNGTGPIESLYIANIPKPTPSAGQALVKVRAFGLNRMDLLQREGRYPVPPQAPKTLGVEFSGTIEEVNGDGGKEGFKTGDEVFGLAYGGAYAEFIVVNVGMLLKKPEHLSWVQAAGIPEVSTRLIGWIWRC